MKRFKLIVKDTCRIGKGNEYLKQLKERIDGLKDLEVESITEIEKWKAHQEPKITKKEWRKGEPF